MNPARSNDVVTVRKGCDIPRLLLCLAIVAISVHAQQPDPPGGADPASPGAGSGQEEPGSAPAGSGAQDPDAVPDPDEAQDPDGFGDLSEELIDLETLMALEIQTAAVATVNVQDIERTPSSVTKITADDMIRLGLDSLADAMRLVPGARVAREHRGSHAVSIRGAPGVYQTQLLASRDGRPIYSPTFAGVQWAKEDYIYQDLAGIEVVRGPGSTVWGANAVNGIINIVTKSAFDTQGLLLETRVGTHEQPMVQVRWGDMVSEDTAYRVYGKWFDREGFRSRLAPTEFNDHSFGFAGFRVDTRLSADDDLTLSGEYYNSRYQFLSQTPFGITPFRSAFNESGGHLLASWEGRRWEDSVLKVSAFLDWVESSGTLAGETRRLAEVNATFSTSLGEGLDLITGGSARYVLTSLKDSGLTTWPEADDSAHHVSVFAQVNWELLPEELWITGGSKFEVNSRSGFEIQPSIRLTWVPAEKHTLWAAWSRSVRTPSLVDQGLLTILNVVPPAAPGAPTQITTLSGNQEYDAERSVVLEGGWRWRPENNLFFETTGFIGFYDDARAIGAGAPVFGMGPGGGPTVTIPTRFENGGQQVIPGVEVRVSYRPFSNWTLDAHYSFLKPDLEEDDFLGAVEFEGDEGLIAKNAVHLRSYLDLGDDWSWNVAFWWQNGVQELVLNQERRSPLYRLDTTLQWRPSEGVQVTLGGRNLLETRNTEWISELLDTAAQIEREFWIGVELRY